MLRKLTLALLGLTASSLVSAGTAGSVVGCTADNVTVPCPLAGWDIGIQALYLKPILTGERVYFPLGTSFREAENDWGWGFALEGSYHFNTGNNLNISWLHYDVSTDAGAFTGGTPFGVANYNLNILNRFDQVNLVMGQHVDFGLVKNAQFYGGLQYASIRNDHNHAYTLPAAAIPAGVTAISEFNRSDFNGVGPVIGINYAYDVASGFSLTANTESSILYGTTRVDRGLVFSPGSVVPASRYGSRKTVVPSVEAKLGLNYAHTLAQGMFNLSGGYQIVNYFNALTMTSLGGDTLNSDFGLYGPYLGINWLGNI
ncbi:MULTISPECIES: Lpg1974 family pore-forming outer membrane protein [Legionella]|uniref:Major outer membrane protein n=1 Tax=Legionella septentrionalis TaxID=2498109 RepID=A0A3S0WT46_9GAMM|nr:MULTISPECIES: Lpg1974 family pore-forming outer membrane protein [Legionella]MCP0914772.1 Lpg1974 family pore-forming outer membrane protein [Legionella sp. 27cVA30]RUQ91091.1 hypothetical protein EKM59_01015 [Legionella septentrionalis]RUR02840.1 hypothetical protein ELY11_00330 [Legionella septentrionalis]RUR11438.1 hypothetical protein ELY14_01440 [Legionella septentrionalis]RUR15087.1 hypothetical protein ELY10_06540 [Legionella septentrionalis]